MTGHMLRLLLLLFSYSRTMNISNFKTFDTESLSTQSIEYVMIVARAFEFANYKLLTFRQEIQ